MLLRYYVYYTAVFLDSEPTIYGRLKLLLHDEFRIERGV